MNKHQNYLPPLGEQRHCSNSFFRSATIPLSGQGEDECVDSDENEGEDDRKDDKNGGREQ